MITHKRGDTFYAECTYADDGGTAMPLTGISVTSAVKGRGGRIFGLTVTILDQTVNAGRFNVEADADETGQWPCGDYSWDVQYSENGFVFSSETFTINVLDDVTP